MKLTFLACLLILCGHAISNMAFQGIPTSQHEDFTLKHGQDDGLKGKMGLSGEGEIKEYKRRHEPFHSVKAKTGGHGSSNIVHRPGPAQRNAATLTSKPAIFLSAITLFVSLTSGLIVFPILPP